MLQNEHTAVNSWGLSTRQSSNTGWHCRYTCILVLGQEIEIWEDHSFLLILFRKSALVRESHNVFCQTGDYELKFPFEKKLPICKSSFSRLIFSNHPHHH